MVYSNMLARLEAADLAKRYGAKFGNKLKYPSELILLEEDEELIGCVGVDAQVLYFSFIIALFLYI